MSTRRDFLTNLLAGFGLVATAPKSDPRSTIFRSYKIGPPVPAQLASSGDRRIQESNIPPARRFVHRQNGSNQAAFSFNHTLYTVPDDADLVIETCLVTGVTPAPSIVSDLAIRIYPPEYDPVGNPFSFHIVKEIIFGTRQKEIIFIEYPFTVPALWSLQIHGSMTVADPANNITGYMTGWEILKYTTP